MAIKILSKKGGGAINVFQSHRRGILLLKSFLYLSSNFVGKTIGNVVVEVWLVVEGVEGSDRVSGSDKMVSDEISFGSFTKFGSHCVKVCVNQCGRRCVEVRGLNGFSRTCSDDEIDPIKSDGIVGVFLCETDCNGEGVL